MFNEQPSTFSFFSPARESFFNGSFFYLKANRRRHIADLDDICWKKLIENQTIKKTAYQRLLTRLGTRPSLEKDVPGQA